MFTKTGSEIRYPGRGIISGPIFGTSYELSRKQRLTSLKVKVIPETRCVH